MKIELKEILVKEIISGYQNTAEEGVVGYGGLLNMLDIITSKSKKGINMVQASKSNGNLHQAKKAKNDEFYTQLSDINNEMKHYKDHFKDKIIFCNCDDPLWSNFWKYFTLNFEHLGLKKLVSTHYEKTIPSYKLECFGEKDAAGELIAIKTPLSQNGDFRSPECVEILKEADIVITNPPFSLFREYITQLVEHDKKFVVVGSLNAITYRETFKLIKENKLWLGRSIRSGDREFRVPEHYPLNASGSRIDEDGNKFIRVKGVRWFTNLEYKERHEDLILYKKYIEDEYPKYDNYDAVNVDITKDIPVDYAGAMGVPITFLDKFNPEQFEIVGITDRANTSGMRTKRYTIDDSCSFADLNARSVLKIGNVYKAVYARILIKNKKPVKGLPI